MLGAGGQFFGSGGNLFGGVVALAHQLIEVVTHIAHDFGHLSELVFLRDSQFLLPEIPVLHLMAGTHHDIQGANNATGNPKCTGQEEDEGKDDKGE